MVFGRNFANLFLRFLSLICGGLSCSGYAWFVVGVSYSMFCGCAVSTLWSLWLFSRSSSSLFEVSKTGWDCLLFGNWRQFFCSFYCASVVGVLGISGFHL